MSDPAEVARRFVDTWGTGDVDAVLALVTEDCTFDSARTGPGGPVSGRAALRPVWAEAMSRAPGRFDVDRIHVAGTTAVVEWTWPGSDGEPVRGLDVLAVEGDLVASKSGYVKVRG